MRDVGRWRRTLFAALLLYNTASASASTSAAESAAPTASDCTPQGTLQFICGVHAAEDSVALPGTPFLLTGGLGFGAPGTIQLIDTRHHTVQALYPLHAVNRPDARHYPLCTKPPDATQISTGGVALQPLGAHHWLFYAANSGGRNAIEVFDVRLARAAPMLTWVGCVELPANTNPNAVTPLGARGLAIVSMDDGGPDRMTQAMAGVATGRVYEWHPGSGLRQIEGLSLRGGNGIAATPDLRWLYVSAWAGGELVRIRRDGTVPPQTFPIGFLPDNLRWGTDGLLWGAAHPPPVERIARCTGNPCMADWLVARVDPRTMKAVVAFEAPGTPEVNYATGMTVHDGNLYITNRGMDRVGVVALTDLHSRH